MPRVVLPYAPRPAFQAFHDSEKRWGCLVCHRRGGKTVAGINQLIRGALSCTKRAPRFAYLAPYRQQAKLVAWDYLKYFTAPIPGISVHESELRVNLPNEGRVTLYGADNYDALRGIYLDGAVVDEPADMAPEVWTDLLRPALSDRLGWCVWIGTPKGRNAFFRLYDKAVSDPEYFTMILPASTSGIIPKSELDSARKAMGKESYEREYECSFNAAVPGSIYGDLISQLRDAGQIQDYAHQKDLPFITSWDVGDSDYCVPILWQLEGRNLNLFDYYSGTGHGPGHYADKMREWELKYGMRIRQHYLPHDAENVVRGSSWKRDLENAGLTNIKIVARIDYKWTGINHVRALLPRFYIHKANLTRVHGPEGQQMPSGLDCLEFYAKHEVPEGHAIKEEPIHNEFSHFCDAVRTFGEAHMRGMVDGTSMVARESRNGGERKVLRGTSPQSNALDTKARGFRGRVLR